MDLTEQHLLGETSEAVGKIKICKAIARTVKSRRAPPWPTPPTPDLPPKHIADELVDRYLKTFETVYRILHIPSFKRDYDSVWDATGSTKTCTAFLVQLKLVLALGAVTYDDTCTLRISAIRWIYEAQTYLAEPVYKPRLGIQNLQTRVLIIIARELLHVGGDASWIDAGFVLRMAITMGMHRDPSYLPDMSLFQTEMRRRLWNTILEVSLQTSMQTGGPPLLATRDFDTGPPGNFNDEDLLVDGAVARPDTEFTDATVARALRQTFAVRLRLAQSLNDLNTSLDKYEDALRLDADMRKGLKAMREMLQRPRESSDAPRYSFAQQATDFIANAAIISVHSPYFGVSMHETAYAFSRRVLIDTALKIWCSTFPSTAVMGRAPVSSSTDDCLFARLMICSSGFFRVTAFRAACIISAEMRSQLRDDEGMHLIALGRAPLRSDLLAVVDEVADWNWRCIVAGETSVRGCVMTSMVRAHVLGLAKGMGREELREIVSSDMKETMAKCLALLEGEAARLRREEEREDVSGPVNDAEMPDVTSMEMNAWDFTVSEIWMH